MKQRFRLGIETSFHDRLLPTNGMHELMEPNIFRQQVMARNPNQKQLQQIERQRDIIQSQLVVCVYMCINEIV